MNIKTTIKDYGFKKNLVANHNLGNLGLFQLLFLLKEI